MNGFFINHLVLTGPNKPDASVSFVDGCNLVVGPSNTGKTFILECINFMFGGRDAPESIAEGDGYKEVWLQLTRRSTGKPLVLRRSIQGGPFRLYDCDLSLVGSTRFTTLNAIHKEGKPDTISAFLLQLSGFPPAKLRKNKWNELVPLTFRLIAHLFVVSESRIVAKQSPIALDKDYERTTARSAFNFLLTGVDNSSLATVLREEVQSTRLAAKREVFESLISDIQSKLANVPDDAMSHKRRVAEISIAIAEITEAMNERISQLRAAENGRQQVWNDQHQLASRQIVIRELLGRFDLLQRHYRSDLQRLEFIFEGSDVFQQLQVVNCPICGNMLSDHAAEQVCVSDEGEPTNIRTACQAEADKVRLHLNDLSSTISALATEEREIQPRLVSLASTLASLDKQITEALTPSLLNQREAFESLVSQQRQLIEVESNRSRLNELVVAMNLLESSESATADAQDVQSFDLQALQAFSDMVRTVLDEWNFPESGVVYFDVRYDQSDIVIAGKRRQANGKGMRGISHASFNIALMRYCESKSLPHPTTIVLDSPLTTYKQGEQREEGDTVADDVQSSFYESVAATELGKQIVIIENKEPPTDLQQKMHIVRFDGPGGTRPGFFPV